MRALLRLSALLALTTGCFGPADVPDRPPAYDTTAVERSDRRIEFSDANWWIRRGPNPSGAGNNHWSDSETAVRLDANRLVLTVESTGGRWRAAEVMTEIPDTKRGAVVTIESAIGEFDPNVVLSIAAARDDRNALGIDLSSATSDEQGNAQFVVFAGAAKPTTHTFEIPRASTGTSMHTIVWGSRVSPGMTMGSEPISFGSEGPFPREFWDYSGPSPNLQRAWLHVRLWMRDGKAPASGQPVSVRIGAVRFF
jgi:hypothetical protein